MVGTMPAPSLRRKRRRACRWRAQRAGPCADRTANPRVRPLARHPLLSALAPAAQVSKFLLNKPASFFCGGVVSRLVRPSFAWTQDFRWHAGDFRDDVESEDRIALGLGVRESAAVDRINDGARVLKAGAFADTISSPGPAGVDEPDTRIVFAQFRNSSAKRRTCDWGCLVRRCGPSRTILDFVGQLGLKSSSARSTKAP